MREPLGTVARSGEVCPESGIWKTSKNILEDFLNYT